MNLVTLPAGPLVSANWLAVHIQQTLVLDCSVTRSSGMDGQSRFFSGEAVYLQRHIPGAQFADLFDGFSASDAQYPFTAPDAASLTLALQRLGVNQNSRIITYDQCGGAYAARVWYLLRVVYGFDNVRVLDGGFAAWQRTIDKLEQGAGRITSSGNIQLNNNPTGLVSTDEVLAAQQSGEIPLICALRSEAFTQNAHIPGSYNVPYPSVLDEQGRIDSHRLTEQWAALGLDDSVRPILYCGGGINAAGLALALVAMGYPLTELKLYDDSLNGWLDNPALPQATGSG